MTNKVNKELETLYKEKAKLKTMHDSFSIKKLEEVESEMAEKYAEDMVEKIREELKGINAEDGGWNSGHLWKLRKKVSPRPTDPPTAMESKDGVILTDPIEIQKEALKYYENLFEDLPIEEDYADMQIWKEKLCKMRLKLCAQEKTDPWTLEDLEIVLKGLKNGTSRDPFGNANELFQPKVAGHDMKLAIVKIVNKIKEQQKIPKCMQLCNITSIYKNKGPRKKYGSYRGIFRVTVLRNILDRLIYNDMYQTMDENLSDCNVGNRRGMNIRDNLFVLNAVLNSAKRKTEAAVEFMMYKNVSTQCGLMKQLTMHIT